MFNKKPKLFIVWGLLFALAYSQSPLFTSNQNQYFLHGSAQAGLGCLSQDWLAKTFDPTPLFSFFVRVVMQFTHPVLFYLVYGVLLGFYFWALVVLISYFRNSAASKGQHLFFLCLLLVVHSAGWRFMTSIILSDNWSYIVEDGFADQRLLGPVLQPSAFGVLLLISIVFFLRNRTYLAVFFSALAASFHPTYLLSAASLTISYLLVMLVRANKFEERSSLRHNLLTILSTAALSLVLVLPILIYTFENFGNTNSVTTELARAILVNVRIPHHALVQNWFDGTAIFKIFWISIAIYFARKTKLYYLLLVPWIISISLTIVQSITQNTFLALLFPWRLSTFLMPVATAILLEKLSSWIFHLRLSPKQEKTLALSGTFFVLLALTGGVYRQAVVLHNQANASDRPLMDFIKQHASCGNLYLIPPKMQDFRLATGQPIYVDFKSIPYRDGDVLEWDRRYQEIDMIYHQSSCAPVINLSDQISITHMVLPTGSVLLDCMESSVEYQDPFYTLVLLKR